MPNTATSHDTGNHQPTKSVYAYIGQRIKERRKLLKMNQSQLGQLMGFSYQQMQKYESGLSEISVGKLLAFSKILNVPPSFFYEGLPLDERIGKGIDSDIIPSSYSEPLRVLLIEPNPNDVIAFRRAISSYPQPVDVHVLHDAPTSHDFLQHHALKYGRPLPDIIILDLVLPKVDGLQMLKWIKKNPQLMGKPVIILTNSVSCSDMQDAYRAGAAGFIQKSVEPNEYTESVQTILKYWGEVAALPRL